MDNYFNECPPMMNDGRLFTDFRSSQVREELFRHNNCVLSENEARTLRIENGNRILDTEWGNLRKTKSCFPRKMCFHKHPTTRVTTSYNNAETLAYNGYLQAPKCDGDCYDFRLTSTVGSRQPRLGCNEENNKGFHGYPNERCPVICPRTNRMKPERLFDEEQ